jgi:hypothetical protein
LRNSRATDSIKGNNFAYWSNFKIKTDLELQIQKILEFDSNFKGVQIFWENPRNSPKIYHAKPQTNIILDDIACISDFNVPLQVAFLNT